MVKSRKEEGKDYFDDYETEKKAFEKDSTESSSEEFDKLGVLEDLKEEVAKSRKEVGQDYSDDYEREKKSFEEDSEEFGIDKFEVLGLGSNELKVKKVNIPKPDSGNKGQPKDSFEAREDSYEVDEDSSELDDDDSEYLEDSSDDSEYSEENSNDSDSDYYSNESDLEDSMESLEDSKKSRSRMSEDGDDYNDDNNVMEDPRSLRKTFYQSHIYPMHLLENLKVCLICLYHINTLLRYSEPHVLMRLRNQSG